MWITKQIFPFFFCFIRELNPYSPLTFSLIPRANSKPYTPPLPSLSAHLSTHPSIHPSLRPPIRPSLHPYLGNVAKLICRRRISLKRDNPPLKSLYSIAKKHGARFELKISFRTNWTTKPTQPRVSNHSGTDWGSHRQPQSARSQ